MVHNVTKEISKALREAQYLRANKKELIQKMDVESQIIKVESEMFKLQAEKRKLLFYPIAVDTDKLLKEIVDLSPNGVDVDLIDIYRLFIEKGLHKE